MRKNEEKSWNFLRFLGRGQIRIRFSPIRIQIKIIRIHTLLLPLHLSFLFLLNVPLPLIFTRLSSPLTQIQPFFPSFLLSFLLPLFPIPTWFPSPPTWFYSPLYYMCNFMYVCIKICIVLCTKHFFTEPYVYLFTLNNLQLRWQQL